MGIGIGGMNASYTISMPSSGAANSATPTWDGTKIHASIGDMDKAFRDYGTEWKNAYTPSFFTAGAAGDGKITQDELNELLQEEFGGMGVNFTDHRVDTDNPSVGKFEVYIDDVNRQKMANDPEYRAKMMSVIQLEMAGTKGYDVQGMGGNHRTTGLSMNMADGDPIFEGVPHSAGGTSTNNVRSFTTTSGGSGESKSLVQQIMERMEEKEEEKKEQEKRDAAKAARQDILDLSLEATSRVERRAAEQAASEEGAAGVGAVDDGGAREDQSDTTGSLVNTLA